MTRYRFTAEAGSPRCSRPPDYVMALPERVQHEAHWQVAVENLINAAETGGGWLMFARIAMMRALNTDGKKEG